MSRMSKEAMKYIFILSYFDTDEPFEFNALPEVQTFFENPIDEHYQAYLDYLIEMKLHGVLGDKVGADMFKYIKPQFRFECKREPELDIIKYDDRDFFIRKNTNVFVTNLFVNNPSDHKLWLGKILKSALTNLDGVVISERSMIVNGTDGYVFAAPYMDWQGVRVCSYREHSSYRLYILGTVVCSYFTDNNIGLQETGNNGVLKNYHKGTPLVRNDMRVITNKDLVSNNLNTILQAIKEEFKSNNRFIKFIQRDYIFDADNFPADLLEELQVNYISPTSVYKKIYNFDSGEPAGVGHTLVIDRYGANKYRKLLIAEDVIGDEATNTTSDSRYIMIPDSMVQIRHTLNAAYKPQVGIMILANRIWFGATIVVDFVPKRDLKTFVKTKKIIHDEDVYYHIGGEYYLQELEFTENGVPVFVVVRIENNLLVRDNLRDSRKLKDLNNNWVKNTILNLFLHN
uniref:p49 n=1 Tax=Spodoptera litura granulovirus TaxID=359919 RepID=C8CHT0_9BBAC|nr:p49 [Spodoptera litura granulovirus]